MPNTRNAKPARLDADRKAKPKTKLVAHVPLDGNCYRATDFIDQLVDVDPADVCPVCKQTDCCRCGEKGYKS